MIELWPTQAPLVEALRSSIRRGHRSTLLVSPTGSGKTVIFSYLVGRMAMRGVRSVILAHRAELLRQISETLAKFHVKHGLVAPKHHYSDSAPVHAASVFSLVRRLGKVAVPDYCIVDEAHHAVEGSTWGKVIEFWREQNPKFQLIGVTATPQRLSGEGLGGMFSNMIVGPTTGELIDLGYLAPYKMFAPPKPLDTRQLPLRGGDYVKSEASEVVQRPRIVGDAIDHYRKHLKGAPTILFAPSVEAAHFYADAYQANGYRAAAIDGTSKDRDEIVRDFSRGALNVLTSCDLISEGFDVPGAHGAQLLRPTESLGLYLQQVGRVLRRGEGKTAIILDHVGNSARHGLPCDEREWSLDGKKRKGRRDPDDIQIRQCSKCGAVSKAGTKRCPECGYVFKVEARKIDQVDGELEEVEKRRQRRARAFEQHQADSLEALIELGYKRGYRNPEFWARKVFESRSKNG